MEDSADESKKGHRRWQGKEQRKDEEVPCIGKGCMTNIVGSRKSVLHWTDGVAVMAEQDIWSRCQMERISLSDLQPYTLGAHCVKQDDKVQTTSTRYTDAHNANCYHC